MQYRLDDGGLLLENYLIRVGVVGCGLEKEEQLCQYFHWLNEHHRKRMRRGICRVAGTEEGGPRSGSRGDQ